MRLPRVIPPKVHRLPHPGTPPPQPVRPPPYQHGKLGPIGVGHEQEVVGGWVFHLNVERSLLMLALGYIRGDEHHSSREFLVKHIESYLERTAPKP